jgi:hypothetical protein
MKRTLTLLSLVTLALLLSVVIALAQGDVETALRDRPAEEEQIREPAQTEDYDLSWWTVDGGGRTGGSETHPYALGGTAGQPDAAVWTGNGYTLAGGFWGGVAIEVRVFLPLVLRGA